MSGQWWVFQGLAIDGGCGLGDGLPVERLDRSKCGAVGPIELGILSGVSSVLVRSYGFKWLRRLSWDARG